MILFALIALPLVLFVAVYGRRLVEIGRCRHTFEWLAIDGYALDQLVCTKCGIPFHWEAWH